MLEFAAPRIRQVLFRVIRWLGWAWVAAAAVAPAADPPTTRPTPAPTATPPSRKIELTAPENQPAVRDILARVPPPLSIYDSGQLLKQSMEMIDKAGEDPPDPDLTPAMRTYIADRMLQTVSDYVDKIDESYPTLPYYSWQPLSSEKLPQASVVTFPIKPSRPIRNVTAVALRVRHGDIEVQKLAAFDEDKTQWQFNQNLRLLAQQPRREVYFLPLSTHLNEVQVTCRGLDVDEGHRPRLYVEAGICSIPESAKQSRYYLQVARDDLRQRRLKEATRNIAKAYDLLQEFKKSRGL